MHYGAWLFFCCAPTDKMPDCAAGRGDGADRHSVGSLLRAGRRRRQTKCRIPPAAWERDADGRKGVALKKQDGKMNKNRRHKISGCHKKDDTCAKKRKITLQRKRKCAIIYPLNEKTTRNGEK